MAASLTEILASLDNGVRAINKLSVQLSNSLNNIPISLAALSSEVYATGNWTPVATFVTPGDLAVVYSTGTQGQRGIWTKIGRQVFAQFSLITTTFTFTTSSGALKITGLPFTADNDIRGSGTFSNVTGFTAFSAGYSFYGPAIPGFDLSAIAISQFGVATSINAVSTTNFTTGTNLNIRGEVIYSVLTST